jgi:hypothetical protein
MPANNSNPETKLKWEKRIILWGLILLSLLCLRVSKGQEVSPGILATPYITGKFEAAIFPEVSPEIFPGPARFTPTKAEVDQAEKALNTQLKGLNTDKLNQYDTPVIDKNLKKYKRQYFGYINTKGERILFINCFWKKDKDDAQLWLRERIRLLDGGSYYWNIKFRIEKNELFDLDVNGVG